MELVNGQYQVQGVALTDVVKEFGSPVYVYDAEKISSQYHHLKSAGFVSIVFSFVIPAKPLL